MSNGFLPTGSLPFSGMKVLDCASYIAAPAAATVLSDFGAEVIKIEPPEGDPYRELWKLPGTPPATRNYAWELDSRNKRSLAIDLKHPEGVKVLHRLAATADVFITNLPLPVRARLALDYDTLSKLNPRLIYASFTAYGEQGPEAEKSGFDGTAYWARSGLMDMVRPDHTAAPSKATAGMGDHPSSMALYGAIVTALFQRERSGKGGLVSTSLLANGLWANSVQVQAHLQGVVYPPRPLREESGNPLSNIYRSRDQRWLSLIVLNQERQFGPLLEALELNDIQSDPRFADSASRTTHRAALIGLFDRQFAKRDLADWRQRLDAAGITFGVIGTLSDITDDEQMRACGALVPFADGSGETVASPIQLGNTTQRPPGSAPALGEHGEAILMELGFDKEAIAALHKSGVIAKN